MPSIKVFCGLFCIGFIACGPNATESSPAQPIQFPVITHGEAVELEPYVEAGKVTVFDFYADWCPPCKVLNASLIDLKKTYGNRLVVIKLDLVSFDSDLAQSFAIKDLPYLIVYNERSELIQRGPSNQVLPELVRHMNR